MNKNANILKAYRYGYTKAEIADYLKLTPSTISRVVANTPFGV
jgi:DNA-binding NarL/FixJ family response regulator